MESAGRNSFNPNKQLKEEYGFNFGPAYKVVPSKKTYKIGASRSWTSFMTSLTTDFLFILFPILLSLTVLADWIYLWALLLILILASFTVIKRSGSSLPSEGTLDTIWTDVSLYRVCLMVVTCLRILAVDFRVFPWRYAKTETYGASLMDLGVGSFVLANAFVSRQARNASSLNLRSALSTTSPLILLGFGQLVSTAGVDYQVHVGGYGVPWNFFFTLAAVAVLSSLINVPPQYCEILGSLVLVGGCLFICLFQVNHFQIIWLPSLPEQWVEYLSAIK